MSEENTAVVPHEEGAPPAEAGGNKASQLKRGPRGTQFNTVEEAMGYATACFRSGMLPGQIQSPQQAFVIMDNGAELGLRPWASWKLLYITKAGRIAVQSKGALAIAQACPNYEYYEERIELEGTQQMRATAIAKRKGKKETVKSFSMEDAAGADLLSRKKNRRGEEYDGPWQSYVKDMLLARARDRALSICFAAELAGIELETMAEDADRLEIKAAGGGVTPVGAPREEADVEEPKALPPPQADPLLMRILEDSGQAPVPVPAKPAVEQTPEEAEIDRSVNEALPDEPPAQEKPKTRKKAPPKGKKPGDLIRNGTRRVVEVDDEGRPTVVEKVKKAPEPDPEPEEKPTHCPREHCKAPLNLIGQCDNCGWPTGNLE